MELTQEQIDEYLKVDAHLKPGYVYRTEYRHFLFLGSDGTINYPNIALNFEDAELTALMVGYSKIFCDINYNVFEPVTLDEFLTEHPEHIKTLSEYNVVLTMDNIRQGIIDGVLKPTLEKYG
jgi:hypothetical protein